MAENAGSPYPLNVVTTSFRSRMNNPPELNLASVEISENRKEKGFHAGWDNIPETLMLVVTELAEAMEEYRKVHPQQWANRANGLLSPGSIRESIQLTYDNFVEEIADTFIRLMGICGALGLDIDQAIVDKVEYNKTREYRHGKAL